MSVIPSSSRSFLWLGTTGLIGFVVATGAPAKTGPSVGTAALVFDSVTVVDVEGGKLLPVQRVVIAGNHIQAVGGVSAIQVPQDAQVVDGRRKYLIPGLWDMHVHPALTSSGGVWRTTRIFYPLFVAHGVTGIRDAGSAIPLDTLRQWRREILAGVRVGPPRQLLSGPAVSQVGGICGDGGGAGSFTGGGFLCIALDTAHARQVVDSLKAAGADMIKVYQASQALYFAIAAEARRVGIPTGGHYEGVATTEQFFPPATASVISDSGAGIFDHLGEGAQVEVDSLCVSATATVARCRPMADRLWRNGTWLVTTRISARQVDLVDQVDKSAAAFWAGALLRSPWLRDSVGVPTVDSAGLLAVAHRVGLPLLAGSDTRDIYAESPGFWLQGELAVLVAEGLSPLEALQSATLNPAKFLHRTDSLGTVAPGKLADLVLLDADPLADITNTTAIRAVVANGRYFDRVALDSLLAHVQADAKQGP